MSTKIEHIFKDNVEHKWCSKIKHWKPIKEFGKNKNTWDGFDNYCSKCKRQSNRVWESKVQKTPQLRERERIKSIKYQKKNRNKFFELYGIECSCCRESVKEFLTIEHKNGQIGISKKESGDTAYRKAIKEYRPDLYEVLCWNCNCSKSRYGTCPHQSS